MITKEIRAYILASRAGNPPPVSMGVTAEEWKQIDETNYGFLPLLRYCTNNERVDQRRSGITPELGTLYGIKIYRIEDHDGERVKFAEPRGL